MAKAKKAKKAKSKKTKKAVTAKKKSAKKSSKKSAKKTAKKTAKKSAKKSAKKPAKKAAKKAATTKRAKKAAPATPAPAPAPPSPEYSGQANSGGDTSGSARSSPAILPIAAGSYSKAAVRCGLFVALDAACFSRIVRARNSWAGLRDFPFRTVTSRHSRPSNQLRGRGIHPKIVVEMQHTPTTYSRKVKTPKKAALACLFSFPHRVPRRRL